jgi:hypothetical protein
MILDNLEFADCVERFLVLTSMPITSMGRNSNNDPRFVYDLRKGRNYSERIKEKVLTFMKEYTTKNNLEFDFNGWRG